MMHMNIYIKLLFFINLSLFLGCTTEIKQFGIYSIDIPEWMLNYEWGRNYYGFQHDENKINNYNFNQNNFFIENNGIYGYRDLSLRLLINPEINFKYLNIIEISYIKDNEKIYLHKNTKIKNLGYRYTQLPIIKFRNYSEYFKNMELNEKINITILQIYSFDEGEIIIEEAPYRLSCFKQEYNPLAKYIPNF